MRSLFSIFAALVLICACDAFTQSRTGTLRIYFLPEASKSQSLDPDNFLLTVTDSKGVIAFDGLFRECPEQIELPEGKCTIFARSQDFDGPRFDAPQFGDKQDVVIQAGVSNKVLLSCIQTNCAIKLNPDWSFLSEYPYGELFFKASDGELLYAYNETRYAYFNPGQVMLYLRDGSSESLLFSRNMASQQMLTLKLSATSGVSAEGGTKFSITVDTTRNYISDNVVVGGAGSEKDNALSVSEARERIGGKDLWVCGYVIGGDLTSSKFSTEAPFKSNTNLVIASRTSTQDREFCMSVQLAKGDIRDALNLVDHPDNLGRKVWLKGNIVEKYYGLPGLQDISEYDIR